MLQQTRQPDLALFARLANDSDYQTQADVPLRILVPVDYIHQLITQLPQLIG